MSFRHTRIGRSLITAVSTFAMALGPIIALLPGTVFAAPSPKPAAKVEPEAPKPHAKSEAASKSSEKASGPKAHGKAGEKAVKKNAKRAAQKSSHGKGKADRKSSAKVKKAKVAKAAAGEPKEVAEHVDFTALSKPSVAESEAPKASAQSDKEGEAQGKPVGKPSRAEQRAKTQKQAKAAKEKHAAAGHPKAKNAGKKKKTASRAAQPKRKTSKSSGKASKKAANDKDAPKPPCFGPAVTIDRSGLERETLSLVFCDGRPVPAARDRLSLLARPWGTPRPEIESKDAPAKKGKGAPVAKGKVIDPLELAPGVRRLDPGLLVRLNTIAKKFPQRNLSIVSGYRPRSKGSLHQSGRALDVRVMGIANEQLVDFCKSLEDTGCGYYPNSSFVHVDVRLPKTGSVSWIDASGPGEAPRYVSVWPPPKEEAPEDLAGGSPKDEAEADAQAPVTGGEKSNLQAQDEPDEEPEKARGAKAAPDASESEASQ